MNIDVAGQHIDTFVVQIMAIGVPALSVIAAAGLFMAVLQAATQIQEGSLVFLPKFFAALALASFAFQSVAAVLVRYMQSIAEEIARYGTSY